MGAEVRVSISQGLVPIPPASKRRLCVPSRSCPAGLAYFVERFRRFHLDRVLSSGRRVPARTERRLVAGGLNARRAQILRQKIWSRPVQRSVATSRPNPTGRARQVMMRFVTPGVRSGRPSVAVLLAVVVTLAVIAGCGSSPVAERNLTGPCAGQPPGCGSERSSATALAGGQWGTIQAAPLSGPGQGEVSVWTGHQVIVWGSQVGSAPPGRDGAAYDPDSDTWETLPASPLSAAQDMVAVWSGQEMIVWGSAADSSPNPISTEGAAFNPTTRRWTSIPRAPLPPLSSPSAVWTGQEMVVVGTTFGTGSASAGVHAAAYDPNSNEWTVLPPITAAAIPSNSKSSPVGTTTVWIGTTLYVWITYQVITPLPPNGVETRAIQQALSWKPGADQWTVAHPPPSAVHTFDATAVWTGSQVALLGGNACLPEESCPPAMGNSDRALFDPATGRWSTMPDNQVLDSGGPVVWTGRSLVAFALYTTAEGSVVGGYASAYDPGAGSWTPLPPLPLAPHEMAGTYIPGPAWTGDELIVGRDALRVTKGGSVASTSSTSGATAGGQALPRCPAISFPAWVNSSFCGPAPGPGNGNGPHGSCLGSETAPPCGPGMEAGSYYPYTLFGSCTQDFIDGRWWTNELSGGSGPAYVWMAVDANDSGAGWIGPNGSVGFKPSTGTPTTPCPASS